MSGRAHIPERCELCGRAAALTRHHLIPRTVHGKRRIRQAYSREELHQRILWVCRPCHSHVHTVLSEKELATIYNTREQLLSHPEIHRFVEWLSARPAGFKPKGGPRRR